MTRKLLLCCGIAVMLLISCAYAAEDDSNVLDISETGELVFLPEADRDPAEEETSDIDLADPAYDTAGEESGNTVGFTWEESDGYWYLYDDSGNAVSGWSNIDGEWYYTDNSGMMITGWLEDTGTWYYLKSSGAMASDESLELDGVTYAFASSGALIEEAFASASDIEIVEDLPVETPEPAATPDPDLYSWQMIGNKWYFINGAGEMKYGWLEEDGYWCYLKNDGSMAQNEKLVIDGNIYNFDENGIMSFDIPAASVPTPAPTPDVPMSLNDEDTPAYMEELEAEEEHSETAAGTVVYGQVVDTELVEETEAAPTPEVIPTQSPGEEGSTFTPTPAPTAMVRPTATPEPTPDPLEVEKIDTLGRIYGVLIFFLIVVLCFFAYKFLRMFF